MRFEDLIRVYEFLQEECNKQDLLYFKLKDINNIHAYLKSNDKPFAIFYVDKILDCIESEEVLK